MPLAFPALDPPAEAERARRWLRKSPASSRAVHEARKSLKRARAFLKLGRGTEVEAWSGRAEEACRRAARALASLRDSRVFAAALDDLLEREAGDLPRSARVRGRALVLRARRDEASALARGAALARARSALRAFPGEPAPGRFARTVAASLEDGLRRSYRRGRRAYRAARSSPRRGRCHDLRKASKRLLHELEGLSPGPRGRRGAAITSLRRLTRILGDEHDMALLRGRLPDDGALAALRRLARRRQRRLRRRALVVAKGLFWDKRPAGMLGT